MSAGDAMMLTTTPVVFLVFNRPEQTARVFARIREARPPILFVVADGPRNRRPGEVMKCRQVREMIERGVDWPCEVVRDYSETNLGCGRRVSSGITNAFRRVEEAIILEDDCLPDPTFFRYCAELLARYREEKGVGLISGSNHEQCPPDRRESYYFCRYGNIWGWATWRRAWQKFDYSMRDWAQWRDDGSLQRCFPNKAVSEFWKSTWDQVAEGRLDTWDYQWTYCYLRHGLLGVLPRVSMIENIGFGAGATHTPGRIAGAMPFAPMQFPLQHPDAIEPDLDAEARASARFFSQPPFWARTARRVLRLVGRWRLR